MSKFKIKAARLHGEKIAKENGFTEFPILPKKIAAENEIEVVAKPPDKEGVSGGIVFQSNDVTIFYATNIESDGYKRFTIGHELGHYFLPGHPEEIQKLAPIHLSRAGFTQGGASIEIEADHFSSGLLMPSPLVKNVLLNGPIGLEGVLTLAEQSQCSLTASAIRAAECSVYPIAVIVSQKDVICYGFLSDAFKKLKPAQYPRKGSALPASSTLRFNEDIKNVQSAERACSRVSFADWFGSQPNIELDEEIIGLGSYGYTLTVLTSEKLPFDPDDDIDEEKELTESWAPKFAYGR